MANFLTQNRNTLWLRLACAAFIGGVFGVAFSLYSNHNADRYLVSTVVPHDPQERLKHGEFLTEQQRYLENRKIVGDWIVALVPLLAYTASWLLKAEHRVAFASALLALFVSALVVWAFVHSSGKSLSQSSVPAVTQKAGP